LVLEINGYVVDDLCSMKAGKIKTWLAINCERLLYKYCAKAIIVTENIKDSVRDYFQVAENKLVVIKNGVNIEHFLPRSTAEGLKNSGLSLNNKYLGYVGCFTPWDGIEQAVQILPEIIREYPQVRLLLIGTGGNLLKVKKIVAEMKLQDKVIFTGMIPYQKLPWFISSFTIALAPYVLFRNDRGLSSLKCLEYASCGIPIVSTRIPGMEYIEQYQAGVLAVPDDRNDLSVKIKQLLSEPQQAQQMGQNGRVYVQKYCSWQATAEKTREVFAETLENKRT
jgi:glycosyltransferase involved in cell wall biosynthesis